MRPDQPIPVTSANRPSPERLAQAVELLRQRETAQPARSIHGDGQGLAESLLAELARGSAETAGTTA
jgi:hypothetical protein